MIAQNTEDSRLPQPSCAPGPGPERVQPRLEVTADGEVRLECSRGGRLADGLVGLLLSIRDAQADGSWDRMKLCGNPDCRWAFYDRSHSRRGAWCDMSSCGNLVKNRNLRARRAQAGSQSGARRTACAVPAVTCTMAPPADAVPRRRTSPYLSRRTGRQP